MPLIVSCGSCGKRLKAPDRLAGKRVRCKCGSAITVPAADVANPMADGGSEISDLSALMDGEAIESSRCPGCAASMPEGAVVCVNCGFNRRMGARMSVAVDGPGPEPDVETKPAKKRKAAAKSDRPPSALPGQLVKLTLVLLLVGGFGWVSYHLVKSATFDPTAQLEADMLKISPRMTVYQVVDAMGRPPKEILTARDPATSDNVVKFVPKKLFWSDDFMEKHSKKELQSGFLAVYKYSEREELLFWFDETGTLISMDKHDPLALIWGN